MHGGGRPCGVRGGGLEARDAEKSPWVSKRPVWVGGLAHGTCAEGSVEGPTPQVFRSLIWHFIRFLSPKG